MLAIDRTGCTRTVFLTRGLAIKVPNLFCGWKLFLTGLLCNMQEVQFGKTGWEGLCPVCWSLPGGFMLVMPRVRVMTKQEFEGFDFEGFVERADYAIPAEAKASSFGFLDGRVVAIDYGS